MDRGGSQGNPVEVLISLHMQLNKSKNLTANDTSQHLNRPAVIMLDGQQSSSVQYATLVPFCVTRVQLSGWRYDHNHVSTERNSAPKDTHMDCGTIFLVRKIIIIMTTILVSSSTLLGPE